MSVWKAEAQTSSVSRGRGERSKGAESLIRWAPEPGTPLFPVVWRGGELKGMLGGHRPGGQTASGHLCSPVQTVTVTRARLFLFFLRARR